MAILKVLLQTSKLAVASQVKTPAVVAVEPDAGPQLVIPSTWEIPKKLYKRYGEVNLAHLHRWWTEWGPQMLQGTNKLVYISGIQLFYSFNLHTGFEGPWCCKKRWYSALADVPTAGQRPWGERSKKLPTDAQELLERKWADCSYQNDKTIVSSTFQMDH